MGGFIAGLAAGFFGIGGGMVKSPVRLLFSWPSLCEKF